MLPRVKGRSTRPLTRLAMVAAALGLFLVGYYWGNQYRRGDSPPPVIEGGPDLPTPSAPRLQVPRSGRSILHHRAPLGALDPTVLRRFEPGARQDECV